MNEMCLGWHNYIILIYLSQFIVGIKALKALSGKRDFKSKIYRFLLTISFIISWLYQPRHKLNKLQFQHMGCSNFPL